jgi:hypothetical protein
LGWIKIPFLPSFNKKEWRVHRWLPFSMYQALFEAISQVEKADPDQWNLPVLIVMDPRDRLVPFHLVQQWTSEPKKDWNLVPILMESRSWPFDPFHFIILQSCVGQKTWMHLSQLVREFLFGETIKPSEE